MENRYLVLVGDTDTGTWTMAGQSTDKTMAGQVFDELKEDGTPALIIFTGDFVQV